MSVVFSTCWYSFKAKFNHDVYQPWINHMIETVKNYHLVIYTDSNSLERLSCAVNNPKIKIVIKPIENFVQFKHKDKWIENHKKNTSLNTRCGWEVNMLWAEKMHFVQQTIQDQYFPDADWYGWCDIGYFRPKSFDPRFTSMSIEELQDFPNPAKLTLLDKTKIHYGLVNPYVIDLIKVIQDKNDKGLPRHPIPPNQVSIAGGFFLIVKENLPGWIATFDAKLSLYFENGYLVKDDQMIIADCVFSDPSKFKLHRENNPRYDPWFMFQRLLL